MSSAERASAPRVEAVRNSALWAAYGDALGFISELAPTPAALSRRIGRDRLDGLTPWKRRVGGKFGVEVELPAGAYSDDTQLRLATGRAIGASGRFDVESFSKIELPVFLAYELGAGRGTRAAASELGKRAVRWANNFFDTAASSYLRGGGNGAAMRIQPHVWSSPTPDPTSFLGDVFTNAICTHGHARGFVGACWHAVVLARSLATGSVPRVSDQAHALESLRELPVIVTELPLIGEVWLPQWQEGTGRLFEEAVASTIEEGLEAMAAIEALSPSERRDYRRMAERVGGLEPETRGSGMTSALLAGFLADLYRNRPAQALTEAANLLGSDTDTIASMAGALLGAAASGTPPQKVLDSEYIAAEAERLAAVTEGEAPPNFAYPDLLKWTLPKTQLDITGTYNDSLAVAGLGAAKPIGEPIPARSRDNAVWQWLRLRFGQTLLVRRREQPRPLKPELLPHPGRSPAAAQTLFADAPPAAEPPEPVHRAARTPRLDLDTATRQAINSGFDQELVGRLLLAFADTEGIEYAVAFAAIVAKARLARRARDTGRGRPDGA